MLVLGASAVFAELQDSLNTIWAVPPRAGHGVLIYLRGRLFSASLVVAVCFLLLGTVVLSTWLNAVEKAIAGTGYALPTIWQWINGGISFVIILILYAAVYRYLPDADVKWKSVLPGAMVAAILFFVGKELIGFYLGKAGVATPFGAAGSLVALVVWIYYSGVLFFIGAELTRAVQMHRTATDAGGRPAVQSR
jgi:membrane protein